MKFFISYRKQDAPYVVDGIVEFLKNLDHTVFHDRDIPVGGDWNSWVLNALSDADVVLVVIGNNWQPHRLKLAGDLVFKEIDMALTRSCVTIAVLVHGASVPSASLLPPEIIPLTRNQAPELKGLRERDFANLISALRTSGIRLNSPLRRSFLRRIAILLVTALSVAAIIVIKFCPQSPDTITIRITVISREGGYIEGKVEGIGPENSDKYKILAFVSTGDDKWYCHPKDYPGNSVQVSANGTFSIDHMSQPFQQKVAVFLVSASFESPPFGFVVGLDELKKKLRINSEEQFDIVPYASEFRAAAEE